MVHFGEFLKTWSLLENSVTRQVNFNSPKIWWKIGRFPEKSCSRKFPGIISGSQEFSEFFYVLRRGKVLNFTIFKMFSFGLDQALLYKKIAPMLEIIEICQWIAFFLKIGVFLSFKFPGIPEPISGNSRSQEWKSHFWCNFSKVASLFGNLKNVSFEFWRQFFFCHNLNLRAKISYKVYIKVRAHLTLFSYFVRQNSKYFSFWSLQFDKKIQNLNFRAKTKNWC